MGTNLSYPARCGRPGHLDELPFRLWAPIRMGLAHWTGDHRWWVRHGDPLSLTQAFDNGGVGKSAAFAHGEQSVATVGALQLIEQRGGQLCSRRTEWMT